MSSFIKCQNKYSFATALQWAVCTLKKLITIISFIFFIVSDFILIYLVWNARAKYECYDFVTRIKCRGIREYYGGTPSW